MPCRPNDERAHRYADLLPPDASPEDITVVAHLHRALATPEPPPHLAVRLRHLARTLPDRRIAARHASARRGEECVREPSLELPEATTWSYPHEPRLTPFRAAAAFLVAATLLLFLVLSFHALLPLAPERPATVTDPAAIPAAPLARSVLTANELRTRLGYQLFVPSPPPPGLVPVYQLAGPDRDAPVSITFFTPDGHTAFVLRQAPADRSPLPDGGEPVPLPDGTVVHAFASSPSADGRPTLEWV
ncbi:MAG: hypothetical protein NZL87_01500, partial [Thermomicrobium sp.]|nr:hypothetical protein [Thermomicrobium sp.]